MRKELDHLAAKIQRIDYNNLYQAVCDIQTCMLEIVSKLDQALPIDKSDDV